MSRDTRNFVMKRVDGIQYEKKLVYTGNGSGTYFTGYEDFANMKHSITGALFEWLMMISYKDIMRHRSDRQRVEVIVLDVYLGNAIATRSLNVM